MSDVDGEDEFQDAQESIAKPSTMDLNTAIAEAKRATDCFFNNDFLEAKGIMTPWATSSMYHSLGNCVFAFLEAILTFEQKHIEAASEALKLCMSVCSKHRRHITLTQNIGKIVKKTNYDNYTIEEVHAELCYAESLLLKAMLTFVEDETLVSFVKAGLKIRTCFLSYKECMIILKTRRWENEMHRVHFESGVRMGIGTFNLMISLLPGRVIKLLEFIGFSGEKNYGLNQLQAGYQERRGLRQVLCALNLLSYHLIISVVLSNVDGDLLWCENALQEQLSLYPNGVWFLFFKGRLEFTRGNLEECVKWYTQSWKSQDLWPQFHHLCFWELMWAHCLQLQWDDALYFADALAENSNWSRTIYLYQKATIMMMKNPDPKSKERDEISALMVQAPTHKQRIAGKSLPMEKFVIKKTERYFAQKKHLVLPVYELMFVWNLFRVVGKRHDLIMNMYKTIEQEETNLQRSPKSEYQADNEALLLLIKGACLRQMKHPLQAENCLKRVISLEKQIKDDAYLVPYAMVELAMLARDLGDQATAITLLEDAKGYIPEHVIMPRLKFSYLFNYDRQPLVKETSYRKNYTGYSLESRLHFRIHSGLMELNSPRVEETVEEATEAITSENEVVPTFREMSMNDKFVRNPNGKVSGNGASSTSGAGPSRKSSGKSIIGLNKSATRI